jgi:hypothetical protein
MRLASAPRDKSHSFSHFEAKHALNVETGAMLSTPTWWSIVHCERQAGSPLQLSTQLS